MFIGEGFGGFALFDIMFVIVFVVVIGTFIVRAVKGIGTWNKNNQSPRLTVDAQVVSGRRLDVEAEFDQPRKGDPV